MRLTPEELEDYLGRVVLLLERYGVVLDGPPDGDIALDESPRGALSFELRGFLPDGRQPPRSMLEIREVWQRSADDEVERWEYEYELLDHERSFRRGFHLHDRDDFVRRFQVVVHEHCEQPIGTAPCPHLAGSPVRDAFRGAELLMDAWVSPSAPGCADLPCLDDGDGIQNHLGVGELDPDEIVAVGMITVPGELFPPAVRGAPSWSPSSESSSTCRAAW